MRCIVVEDERIILNGTVEQLRAMGRFSSVAGFDRPLAALDHAKSEASSGRAIDIAFVDVEMTDMDGISLARELAKIYPKLNIIFVTAYRDYAVEAFSVDASGYVLKPLTDEQITRALDHLRWPVDERIRGIYAQTFGRFDVFVDGAPIRFEREKARELLAVLVDAHGSRVSTEQIAATLWEDKNYNASVKSMTTKIISTLVHDLQAVGAEAMIEKSWGHVRAVPEKFRCDAYALEAGDVLAARRFAGEYMSDYSWAEFRAGELVSIKEKIL